MANRAGLTPAAHQHSHVARGNGAGLATARVRAALIEQTDHLGGEECGHLSQKHVFAGWCGVVLVPDGHGGLRRGPQLQRMNRCIAGHDGLKRHLTKRFFELREHMVHGRHHARRGAIVT